MSPELQRTGFESGTRAIGTSGVNKLQLWHDKVGIPRLEIRCTIPEISQWGIVSDVFHISEDVIGQALSELNMLNNADELATYGWRELRALRLHLGFATEVDMEV